MLGLGNILPLLVLCWTAVEAKIYERCELASELAQNFNLPQREAAMWTCLAEQQSNLDTSALGGSGSPQYHGIFQISDEYWCSPPGKGFVCGVDCASLRDDRITDDLACVRNYIYEEHQRISGDGFNAWPAYQSFCKSNVETFVSECFAAGDKQKSGEAGKFADDKGNCGSCF